MANLGNRTRKQQVLGRLLDAAPEWVDGPELANEAVGGSEGLRRLRELIDEGYPIRSRRHPNPNRDIWQYRFDRAERISPIRQAEGTYVYVAPKPKLPEPEADAPSTPSPELLKFTTKPKVIDFGSVAVCPRCHGKEQRYRFGDIDDKRHKDPIKAATPCIRCNGWGIIPNVGPIALTAPEGME